MSLALAMLLLAYALDRLVAALRSVWPVLLGLGVAVALTYSARCFVRRDQW